MSRSDEIQEEGKTFITRVGRTIYFFGEINSSSVGILIKLFDELEIESKKPIEFIIDSKGGDVYEGLHLYDRIRFSECQVCTLAGGLVASMALIVFLAGDKRSMHDNARLMNHQTASNLQGKVNDIKIEAEELKLLEKTCLQLTADRTGLTVKKIEKDISKGDDYIYCDRALAEGFVHSILKRKNIKK